VAQKNVAESVLRERRVMVPVVSVVKDDSHRPKALLGNAAMIKKFRPAILRVNAEAHRFAKKYHAARRAGSFLRSAVSVR
jgi:excinuclease UvrABC nuclease subunit